MTKQEHVTSIIRHLLSAVAGYLAIKGLDGSVIEGGAGVVMAVVAVYWSIKDKTADQSTIAGVVRQLVSFIGGIFIEKGQLDPETLDSYLGAIVAILPIILKKVDKTPTTPTTPQQ